MKTIFRVTTPIYYISYIINKINQSGYSENLSDINNWTLSRVPANPDDVILNAETIRLRLIDAITYLETKKGSRR